MRRIIYTPFGPGFDACFTACRLPPKLSFSYQIGHGVGFANAMRDSAKTALGSTRATLIGATWLVATLGPPALLLLILLFLWVRWGRRLWDRLFVRTPD